MPKWSMNELNAFSIMLDKGLSVKTLLKKISSEKKIGWRWMRFNCSLCGISVAEFFCTKWEYVIVKNKEEEGKMKKKCEKHADWPASSQRVRVTHSRRLIIGPIRDYCTQIIIMINLLQSTTKEPLLFI